MSATMKDVAKLSGSSITTVSRVLNESEYPVSEKLKNKILHTAKQLNYAPDLVARSLKKKTGNEIAVITPSIRNPYYTDVIRSIEQEVSSNGYGLLIYVTGKNGRESTELAMSLRGRRLAGILVASDSVDELLLQTLRLLRDNGTPVVLFDYNLPRVTDLPGVFFDYEKGATMATEYLLKKGHKKIAFAAGRLDRTSRQMRYNSFRAALAHNNIVFPDYYLLLSAQETSFEAGIEMAEQLLALNKLPTAVLAVNDTVGCGLIHGLVEKCVSVPEDISIIGFDNLIYAYMCFPALTTIDVPTKDMGVFASQKLMEEINGTVSSYNLLLTPMLIERKTVSILKSTEDGK